jgi:glycosyltransferase involved in cell wall biosynthesis
MSLYVDTRWSGLHGIGRVADEVVPRLTAQWRPLPSRKVNPWSPLDALNSGRWGLGSDDLIYNPGYNAGLTRARQLLTVHDLIHLHDSSESSRAKRAYYQRVVAPAIKKCGVVLTVSETSRAGIARWLDTDVDVVVVGNGCSEVFTHVPEGHASELGERSGLLYVGSMKPHKNLDVVWRALALRPHLRLTAVVPDTDALHAALAPYGITDQVTVRSGLSDAELAVLYRSSEALVMPSTLEGFGLPAVEAIATGTPVIYWEGCDSVAEIASGCGIAVADSHDAANWADACDRVTEIPAPRPSPQWWARYSWDQVAANVSATIARVSEG